MPCDVTNARAVFPRPTFILSRMIHERGETPERGKMVGETGLWPSGNGQGG